VKSYRNNLKELSNQSFSLAKLSHSTKSMIECGLAETVVTVVNFRDIIKEQEAIL
jgi:hypothetical protein